MSLDGYVSDVRALHAGARCVQIDLVDAESGRVVLSDLADAARAEERAVWMLEFMAARSRDGGAA